MVYDIIPLGQSHVRESFSCGENLVDQFCKTAHPEHFASKRKMYVCCADDGVTVIGYYSIIFSFLQENRKQRINEPAVHIEMIGVSKTAQHKGLGSALLIHALKNACAVADIIGVKWIFLEAINTKSAAFYERLGFTFWGAGRKKLVLPIDSVRTLINEATDT